MDDHFDFLATLVLILLAAILMWSYFSERGLPPGPLSIPILGSLPFINARRLHFTPTSAYGKIFHVYLGNALVIVLNDFDVMHQAFVKQGDLFSHRPAPDYLVKHVTKSKDYGIVHKSGEALKQQRTFVLRTMRSFGVGKQSFESNIISELNHLVEALRTAAVPLQNTSKENVGNVNLRPVDIYPVMQKAVSNVMCSIIFGSRFEYDDARFCRALYLIDEGFIKRLGTASIMRCFPWMKHIPGDILKLKEIEKNMDEVMVFIKERVDQHKETFDRDNLRDFIDVYFKEMENQDPVSGRLNEKELAMVIRELFIVGSESVTVALHWGILFMLHNQEVQSKVREEIHQFLGRDGEVTVKFRPEMIYTEATIFEILRRSVGGNFSMPRAVANETTLCGYRIPASAIILANRYNMKMGEKYFENPETFKPERFIGEDGKLFKPDYFAPFGIGRRSCLGEQLAHVELFLMFVGLLQNFQFLPLKGEPLPSLEPQDGVISSPLPFKVLLSA